MELYERYRDCADTLDKGWLRRSYDMLPTSLRSDMTFEDFKTAQILAEMRTRDPLWLNRGIEPEVEFASQDLRKDKVENHMDEIRTARRLKAHGVRIRFVTDEEVYFDEEKGQQQTRGLPDLADGIELKCLDGASSYNTINGHIKNASSKDGTKVLVFDNSQNAVMSDEELMGHIERSQRFRRGKIYIIGHEGMLRRIR